MNEREEKEALAELSEAYQARVSGAAVNYTMGSMLPELRLEAAYLLLRSKFDEALELIADLRMDLVDVRQSVRWLESDQ